MSNIFSLNQSPWAVAKLGFWKWLLIYLGANVGELRHEKMNGMKVTEKNL